MPSPLQALYRRLPLPGQWILVQAAGWQSYRKRFGPPFRRALDELRRTDLADAEAVRSDQDRRVRELVSWAATTVPYYRDLFRREGIDPAGIRGTDDLAKLPTLSKETVAERGLELVSEAVPRGRLQRGQTSGTTGTALALYQTPEPLGWEYAAAWRQRGWFGLELGARFAGFGGQQIVPSDQKAPPFWRYEHARARMLFSVHHMKPENMAAFAAELGRPGYRFWQGYPSTLSLMADYLLEAGIELGEAAPVAVFTSSETLLESQRERITRATGAPVADRYANSELCVSVSQCPQGSYHVDTEVGVVEIDPHEEGPEQVRGEILATGLANRVMVFLRYRTGDVATLPRRSQCACGRARPILERIDGRIEDYILTPDGQRLGRMDHIFKRATQVREAQIVQTARDRIVVRLVPRTGFGSEARRQLEEEFRSRLGEGMEIVFEILPAIPRQPNGKFRAVVSELAEGRLR